MGINCRHPTDLGLVSLLFISSKSSPLSVCITDFESIANGGNFAQRED